MSPPHLSKLPGEVLTTTKWPRLPSSGWFYINIENALFVFWDRAKVKGKEMGEFIFHTLCR